jgi:hypothetical protein
VSELIPRKHREFIGRARDELRAHRITDERSATEWRTEALRHDALANEYRNAVQAIRDLGMKAILGDAEIGQREAAGQCRRIADHAELGEAAS